MEISRPNANQLLMAKWFWKNGLKTMSDWTYQHSFVFYWIAPNKAELLHTEYNLQQRAKEKSPQWNLFLTPEEESPSIGLLSFGSADRTRWKSWGRSWSCLQNSSHVSFHSELRLYQLKPKEKTDWNLHFNWTRKKQFFTKDMFSKFLLHGFVLSIHSISIF